MLRSRLWLAVVVASSVAACATGGPADETKVEVIKPDVQDVSLPLRELAKVPVIETTGLRAHEAEPARPIPHDGHPSSA